MEYCPKDLIPSFNPEEGLKYSQWLKVFNQQIKLRNIKQEDALFMIPTLFKGNALEIYATICDEIDTLEDLHSRMMTFFPEFERGLNKKFWQLTKQETQSVRGYYFEKVKIGTQLHMPKDLVLESLTSGAGPLEKFLIASSPHSLEDWLRIAESLEHTTQQRDGRWNNGRRNNFAVGNRPNMASRWRSITPQHGYVNAGQLHEPGHPGTSSIGLQRCENYEADMLSRLPYSCFLSIQDLKEGQESLAKPSSKLYFNKDNITYIRLKNKDRIVVPPSLQQELIIKAHESLGHPGISSMAREKNESSRLRAEKILKTRAQLKGESTEYYIQDVLRLCKEVDPQMNEKDKISHQMKGIAEELYQALLPRDVHNTEQFVTECRRIESLHCKRVTPTKYERLPNVASLSDHDDRADLSSMIRQIVREEVQRALGSTREEPKFSTIEDMVKEEIGRTLAPIPKPRRSSPQKERPREFYDNRYVAQTIRPHPEPQYPKQGRRRDTNEWRTTEGKPICFHCGRPGHVVRYCRDRRREYEEGQNWYYKNRDRQEPRTFYNSRSSQEPNDDLPRENRRRYRSPSPYTGRKGQYSSPDRRPSQSPLRSHDSLDESQKEKLRNLLKNYTDIFEFSKRKQFKDVNVKHRINTGDHLPTKQRPYRVAPRERQIIQDEVNKMEKLDIIQPSESPWASPVVLIRKKDVSWRFCVDYRRLNKITKKDVYPLPRIDDTLDCLRGARFYSSMDLQSGYCQIDVEESDREKTAFITPDGLYEFKVMPFGLCNAPATFERMIDNLLKGLKWTICLCYLDDIIVFSDGFEEHLRRLQLAGITKKFHDSPTAGHLGFTKAYDRIRKRYNWPGMYRTVRRYVAHCSDCQRRKHQTQLPSGHLQPIPVPEVAFEKVGMDLLGRFLTLEGGNRWIIVCTDYLTKYAITKALPTSESMEVAKFFIEDVILKHGAPRELITDRGRNFTSSMISDLNNQCRITHRKTTAYHPQTNGLTERLNKTIADMLSMMKPYLNPEDQEDQLEEDPEDDSTNFQEEDIPTERTQQPQTREEISGPITRSRALRLRIKFLNLKYNDKDDLDIYFKEKSSLVKKLNLDTPLLLEALTDGMPNYLNKYLIAARVKETSDWIKITTQIKYSTNQEKQEPQCKYNSDNQQPSTSNDNRQNFQTRSYYPARSRFNPSSSPSLQSQPPPRSTTAHHQEASSRTINLPPYPCKICSSHQQPNQYHFHRDCPLNKHEKELPTNTHSEPLNPGRTLLLFSVLINYVSLPCVLDTASSISIMPLTYLDHIHYKILDNSPNERIGQVSVQLERVGKLIPADRVATSSSAGIQDCRNLRLFVTDKNTGLRFLVDSGADISIIPPKDKNRMPSSDYKLYAANSTEIVTYGTKVRNLDIGLRRQFQWPFVIANTNRAIIGADFLSNFGLIIDIKNKRLIDGITNLSIRGVIQSISDMGNISTLNSSSKVSAILTKYPNLCRPPSDFVEAKHSVKHYIPTRGQPIHSKARRLDSQRLTLAKAEFQYMLNNGIIRPSNSPWASPLHLVSKKDESLRPCGDYRRLNAVTLPDRYPIPRLDDFHHILKGTRVYSKIDLCKAFYQIPIAEEDKPKTSIITPFGLFEFNVMSFGLRNATATFQRFMHEVLRNLDFAFVYLDDILVASKTEEEHYSYLETLFSRLNSYGLRINLSKSKFLVQEIDFLGYLITSHGVKPLPTKVKAILEYKKPKTVHELRIFLGMLNFYRTFLNNAAETQAILHEYLRGAKKKDRSEIKWTEEAEVQFEKCKQALANTALLAFPDTELPISLCTDASDRAVGSVLQQLDNNNWKPIAFFSKKLNPAQCNYSTYDKELLAIYLSIKFFKHLLEAREFTILNDHKPLIYAFKQKNEKASPRQLRHLQYISQFTTDIKYIKGTDNIVADALSRVDAITTIDYEEIAKEQT
ncbi:hypothetical protein LAZ67_2003234, partial [Cordylochernes scorpioides]